VIDNLDSLPYSLDAESSVLGAILLQPDLFESFPLRPEMFYNGQNALIFDYMGYLNEEGTPLDILTIARVAGDDVMKIGGIGYLSDLMNAVPTVANYSYYAQQVRDLFSTREIMRTLSKSLAAGSAIANPTKYLMETLSALESLTGGQSAISGTKRLSTYVPEHRAIVKTRKEAKGLTGAKSCSDDLNKMTGGYQDQEFSVVAARPSMGKTAFILNDAVSVADEYLRKGINGCVPIFSLEMGGISMLERVICVIGGIEADKLRTGEMTEDDWTKYNMAEHRLNILPIYINEDANQTIESIGQEVKVLKRKYDKIFVLIDFLQLVEVEKSGLDGHAKIAHISKSCKRIARKNKCHVCAISAVGRKVEERQDKRPMMSDLRESGSIESDADIVIFLYRDDYYDKESKKKGIIELIVAKGRNIGTGTIEMVYAKQNNRFLNIDHSHHYKGA
jgi:replicative DNA helicase